jgi:siroheme synthase-like protein
MFYPVFINLRNRPVLVVGGGTVAERKVETLLEAGAAVTVVSPEATKQLLERAHCGRITLHRRCFVAADMDGAALAISATDDAATQLEVASIATAKNILINTVDKPDLCDFIVPAILRRGDVTIAISTAGKSPALAAALRQRLDLVLTEEVSRTADVLGAVRNEVHERFTDSAERQRVFERIIASGIVEWIGGCDDATALQRVRQMIDEMA